MKIGIITSKVDAMSEPISTSAVAAHGVLAFFGAVVHAARAHREGQSKTWTDFTTLTIMSSFSGVMFSLLGFYLFPHEIYITMAMSGTGGFLGVEGLSIVIERIRKLIASE